MKRYIPISTDGPERAWFWYRALPVESGVSTIVTDYHNLEPREQAHALWVVSCSLTADEAGVFSTWVTSLGEACAIEEVELPCAFDALPIRHMWAFLEDEPGGTYLGEPCPMRSHPIHPNAFLDVHYDIDNRGKRPRWMPSDEEFERLMRWGRRWARRRLDRFGLGDGTLHEDIAHEGLVTLLGWIYRGKTRKGFEYALGSAINGHVSNLLRQKHLHRERLELESKKAGALLAHPLPRAPVTCGAWVHTPDPEAACIGRQELHARWCRVRNVLDQKADDVALAVLDLGADLALVEPGDVQQELGLGRQELYNARRRISKACRV